MCILSHDLALIPRVVHGACLAVDGRDDTEWIADSKGAPRAVAALNRDPPL